ncbi:MAG: RnfABCDGE type electron transport complex subunit B [Christensenellales bacterium]|jgi:electron transport complex protein RnfB|nr:RnfABCDGE type electron transport complex subunit B [Clostridiales bacterium]
MEIVIPLIILGVMAAIFAVILAIAGIKLAVVQDERVEKITSLLTGANCGGCGYAGCQAFAQAIVEGNAKVTDCPSTTKENKALIAEIMGSELGEVEQTIVVCACNGGNRCLEKYEYQGYGDCASIELLAGGRKACPTGCIGAGKCSDVCPYHAVEVNSDGVAKIDQKRCVQCGTCIIACPKKLMKRLPAKAKIYIACSNHGKGKEVRSICKVGCMGCGLCAKVCEHDAIVLKDGLPVIDYDKCVNCRKCVEKCPAKCILTLD